MATAAKTPEQKLQEALAKQAKAEREVAEAKLAMFSERLDSVIATKQIPKLFEELKATGADEITALAAIGKAAGIKNLKIAQEKTAKNPAKEKTPEQKEKAREYAKRAAEKRKEKLANEKK